MAKYQVGWTYTVWFEVEADNTKQAFDRALEVRCNFDNTSKSGVIMELDEYRFPIINELENNNT